MGPSITREKKVGPVYSPQLTAWPGTADRKWGYGVASSQRDSEARCLTVEPQQHPHDTVVILRDPGSQQDKSSGSRGRCWKQSGDGATSAWVLWLQCWTGAPGPCKTRWQAIVGQWPSACSPKVGAGSSTPAFPGAYPTNDLNQPFNWSLPASFKTEPTEWNTQVLHFTKKGGPGNKHSAFLTEHWVLCTYLGSCVPQKRFLSIHQVSWSLHCVKFKDKLPEERGQVLTLCWSWNLQFQVWVGVLWHVGGCILGEGQSFGNTPRCISHTHPTIKMS
jgi:hypothetical protein